MMKPIPVSSEQGQRIHAFLTAEFGIPELAQEVTIHYAKDGLFKVTVAYLPGGKPEDISEVKQ